MNILFPKNAFPALLALTAALYIGAASSYAKKPEPPENVIVGNTNANPVPVTVPDQVIVRDADNPAQRPFQDSFSLEIDPGSSADKDESFAVNIPAGTRLVIERINVLGEMPVGQKLIGVYFSAFTGGSAAGSFTGANFHGTSPSGVIFGGPLDIYAADTAPAGMAADPGANNISISAFRDTTTGTAHVFVQVFGHIVQVP